jgi:hypothetical protein
MAIPTIRCDAIPLYSRWMLMCERWVGLGVQPAHDGTARPARITSPYYIVYYMAYYIGRSLQYNTIYIIQDPTYC